MTVLLHGLGVALGLALLAAWLFVAHAIAHELDADAPLRLRSVATIAIATWLAAALFLLLSPFAAFGRPAVALTTMLATLIVLRRDPTAGARFVTDATTVLTRARDVLLHAGPALAIGTIVVAVPLVVRFARATLAPPLGWDALTYHLVRAGQWLQQGGFAIERAPDAAGYYAYYPPIGDALWSWCLLPTHDDGLLAFGGALALAACALGSFVAAREHGASAPVAAWATLALLATPAVSAWSTAVYVDTWLLASTLWALAWLPRALARPHAGPLAVVLASVSIAAGTKTTGLPLALLFVLALTWPALAGASMRQRGQRIAIAAVVLSLGAFGYAIAWIDQGNPLYPFPLRVLGHELAPGNEENTLLHEGAFFRPSDLAFHLSTFFRALFGTTSRMWPQHLNFGPAAPLVLVLVPWSFPHLRRSASAWILLALVLVFAVKLGSHEMLTLRTVSAQGVGRFLTIPFAALILLGVRAPTKIAVPVLAIVSATGTALSWPRGMGPVDARALAFSLPLAALTLALAVVLARILRTRPRTRVLVLVVLATTSITVLLPRRMALREPFYRAQLDHRSYDPHPLDRRALDGARVWTWLEHQPPLTLAFAAGWDGRGHHWYRAPLLGARLQHTVLYVPPTRDGTHVDYRRAQDLERAADLHAWVARLLLANVDVVVLGSPASVEHRFVLDRPDLFEPVVAGEALQVIAFRLRRDRLPH